MKKLSLLLVLLCTLLSGGCSVCIDDYADVCSPRGYQYDQCRPARRIWVEPVYGVRYDCCGRAQIYTIREGYWKICR